MSLFRAALAVATLSAACHPAPPAAPAAGPSVAPAVVEVSTVEFSVTVNADRVLPARAWVPALPGDRRAPVVAMSHGWGGKKEHAAYLAQRLAAAGYLVVALDHLNDSQASALVRPRDISALLDTVADAGKAPALAARADLEHVAVYGHSFGGFTALALGGARLGPNPQWTAHCAAGPAIDCPAPPEGAMPTLSLRDPRVDLVIGAAPAGYFQFGDAGVNAVEVPTLIIAAATDAMMPLATTITPLVAQLRAPHLLVTLRDATHMTFADLCPALPKLPPNFQAELTPQCDGTGPMAIAAAHALIGDLILAELAHVFADGPAPDARALAAAAGVAVELTGP